MIIEFGKLPQDRRAEVMKEIRDFLIKESETERSPEEVIGEIVVAAVMPGTETKCMTLL